MARGRSIIGWAACMRTAARACLGGVAALGGLALMAILLVLAARGRRAREPAAPPVRPAEVVAPSPR